MSWQPIETKPTQPVQVELFYSRLVYTDQDGKPCPEVMRPPRDERRQMGYWDGETFREMGTEHCCFETWRTDNQLPTHWRPLPDPPASTR